MNDALIITIVIIIIVAAVIIIFYCLRKYKSNHELTENEFKGGEIKVKKVDENGNFTNEYKLILFLYAITGNVKQIDKHGFEWSNDKLSDDAFNLKKKVDEYIENTSEYLSIKQVGAGTKDLIQIMRDNNSHLYINSNGRNTINIESIYEIEYSIPRPENKKKTIYLYHETRPDQLLNVICNRFSFDSFGQADFGFFGQGIYFEKAFTDNSFKYISGTIFDDSHVGFKLICEVSYDNYAFPTYPVSIQKNKIPDIEKMTNKKDRIFSGNPLINKISRVLPIENDTKEYKLIHDDLFSNEWFNGNLDIPGMPKEKVDVLAVPYNIYETHLRIPYQVHEKIALWSHEFSQLTFIYSDTFTVELNKNFDIISRRKNIINFVLSCIMVLVIISHKFDRNSDIDKEKLKTEIKSLGTKYMLKHYIPLGFSKNYDDFLDDIINWFINNKETTDKLKESYKSDKIDSNDYDYESSFLLGALKILMNDFNNGFNGLVNPIPIKTCTLYTTEAVGELVVNDVSLIRPKYIVAYTTTRNKVSS